MVGELVAQQLATNLRRLRDERSCTQQQLSELSGVPRATLAHLESGEGNPTLTVLIRVATALGATLEQLVESHTPQVCVQSMASLTVQRRGQAACRALWLERTGLSFERTELPARGRLPFAVRLPANKLVMACEAGRVELEIDGVVHRLRSGDLAVLQEGTEGFCLNPGARLAVLYALLVPNASTLG